jgi:hypothetical protein
MRTLDVQQYADATCIRVNLLKFAAHVEQLALSLKERLSRRRQVAARS